MIAKLVLALMAAGSLLWPADWMREGDRAFDAGRFDAAAAAYAQALTAFVAAGKPVNELVSLRVTLATAYLESGEYRDAEAVLREARASDDAHKAALLNAWSALHLKLGQTSTAEKELHEAFRLADATQGEGDLAGTVLHNLAAIEMRTGRYAESLAHESEAMRRLRQTMAPDDPTLIRGWASLASLQYMLGEPGEAAASMEHAIHSAEITYGPQHPLLADLLRSDAIVLDKLKLHGDARRARERAARISRGLPAESTAFHLDQSP